MTTIRPARLKRAPLVADGFCRLSAGGYSLTDLTPDLALWAFGQGINDAGDVAGVAVLNNAERAFRWRGGVLTDLTEAGDDLSDATAINASGVVVGFFIPTTGKANAFRWENDVRTTLPSLSPPNTGGDDRALGISVSGTIVGHSVSFGSGQQLPVIWQNGGITTLPLPAGGIGGEATGINDTGRSSAGTPGAPPSASLSPGRTARSSTSDCSAACGRGPRGERQWSGRGHA